MEYYFSLSPAQLANIHVSIATGTILPAYKSPAVTSVITAEQIQSMGATQLHQVLETVPGVHVSIQAITNDVVYLMRGMRNGTNSRVLVLMNGVRMFLPYKGSLMTGLKFSVENIQKVEIIRGPGSALYGADAFAGVINIITKKSKDINGVNIGVRTGQWDTHSAWGQYGGHTNGWDIAASLQYNHNNNDDDRIITADAQSQFDQVFSTSASLAPGPMQTKSENWEAHLNLQRQYWDFNFWTFNSAKQGLQAGAGGALDEDGTVEGQNYLTDLHYSSEELFIDWEFLAHASYLHSNIDSNLNVFPNNALLPIDSKGNINPNSAVGLSFFPDGALTQIGIENQVAAFEVNSIYNGLEQHLIRFSAGYRYEKVKTRESRNFGFGVLDGSELVVNGTLTNVTGTDLVFLPDSDRSIWSVAIQDEWKITQSLQLTAGLRYDNYSDFGSTINPRVALVWDVSEQLNTKLLYGRAFRAPSFLEQKQQNSTFFIGKDDLKPETIDTIELAFDYRPYKNLRLTNNLYYFEIDNLISASTIVNNELTASNTAGQIGFGAEIEWNWQFHHLWNLKGNYSWQYAREKENNRRVHGVPEHLVYLATSWQFLPKWQIQGQLNWVGNRLGVEGDSRKLKDYETIDLTLNSKKLIGHIEFSASVRNILDSRGNEPANDVYPDHYPVASRSFYIQTSLHF